MATKQHCDLCDVTPAKDKLTKNVNLEHVNRHDRGFTVTVTVARAAHGHITDDDDRTTARLELCDECFKKAVRGCLPWQEQRAAEEAGAKL
jgi:hypothetical protein